MTVFIGIDIGTSGTKTLAIREDGTILASANATYPLMTPQPNWSEQSPADWWDATVTTVQKVIAKGNFQADEIGGVGLSGQMHGSVFLDDNQQVIRPAILWNDQRTQTECEEIEAAIGGRKKLIEQVANPALTGFTAPKLLWLRKHEPQHYERVRHLLLPKDYIRFRLTGEFATEVSDASGTLLLDVANRCWSGKLLDALQIDPAILPRVYESEDVTGKITGSIAKQLGVPNGTPVVGGGGDQAAGAIGNGITQSGAVSATIGTSGVVFAHSDEMQIDPSGRVHTFCHAVRDKWHVMGVVLSAGGSLQWYRNALAQSESTIADTMGTDPYELIDRQAAQAPPGSENLFFLPYLTGERTPHADPFARAAWIGLSLRHSRPHLARSVMEGATYAMRDSFEIIQEMNIPVTEIRASGGGAQSQFWRQMQADIYGHEVVTINAEEGPAYGVALLAAAGTGAYKNVTEACKATITLTTKTTPNPKAVNTYNQQFPMYQKLYHSLKENFQTISQWNG